MKFLNKKSNILIANNILSNQDYSFNPDYYVYTDGACKHNGKNYSRAGIGIYFGLNNDRNVSIKLEGSHTNNTAELLARPRCGLFSHQLPNLQVNIFSSCRLNKAIKAALRIPPDNTASAK